VDARRSRRRETNSLKSTSPEFPMELRMCLPV
jgi:hypothetical protein